MLPTSIAGSIVIGVPADEVAGLDAAHVGRARRRSRAPARRRAGGRRRGWRRRRRAPARRRRRAAPATSAPTGPMKPGGPICAVDLLRARRAPRRPRARSPSLISLTRWSPRTQHEHAGRGPRRRPGTPSASRPPRRPSCPATRRDRASRPASCTSSRRVARRRQLDGLRPARSRPRRWRRSRARARPRSRPPAHGAMYSCAPLPPIMPTSPPTRYQRSPVRSKMRS